MSEDLNARRRRWILAGLMATMMLAAMDATIVSTAIPQIVGDLGGFSLFTWVFSIYLLMQTVTIPVYGKFADMFGRKPVLIVGALIFLAGSAASAASWDMLSLIVFRGLQGLGAGSIMATVNTIAGDLYSVRERARIQGWLSSVWGMAAVIGPAIGGAFAEYASWRWIFLINLPVGAAAIALIAVFLHERVEHRRHCIDFAGAGLMFLAIGALIFGLLQGGQSWPWLSAPSLVVFAAALVLIAATIWVERRAAEPIMPGWLWRKRVLAGTNMAMICMGLVMMGPIAYLPTFAQSVLGLGAIAAGFVLAAMSIGWPLASWLSGRVYLRAGFRDSALGGAVLIIVAALGFLLMPRPGSGWMVALDQFVLGAGFGLLSTPLLVGVQSVVGWQGRGIVTGVNIFSRYLGQSIGAAVFGAIFNATITARLTSAPAALRAQLPNDINAVIDALHGAGLDAAAGDYLRRAIHAATHHIYIGILAVAVLTLIVVLFTPRRFPVVDQE
ncbi:MAG: MFS transporter [Gammaproteobacteria bacterium]|nr:MFS transporter [Gammaproteobacteria bacterium]